MDATPLALETRGLRKRFGDLEAVAGIDLAVPAGSFYGFLGPNGAGKSTTIKCLTGLLAPDDGEVRILGLDPAREPIEVRRRVGVVPEDLALFDHLDAWETLRFVGRVHQLEPATIAARSADLLAAMDLTEAASSLAAEYSHGMRKKLALAVALLPAPRFLFLDEPFEGLDAVASRHLRLLLERFVAGGGTIFLTSHILAVVERLCDRIGVIYRGRLVAQGRVDELRADAADGATLEELFLRLVGAEEAAAVELSWL